MEWEGFMVWVTSSMSESVQEIEKVREVVAVLLNDTWHIAVVDI